MKAAKVLLLSSEYYWEKSANVLLLSSEYYWEKVAKVLGNNISAQSYRNLNVIDVFGQFLWTIK